ncbi:MAG: VanZ family protein [Agriterribacter sp.]
MPQNNVNSNKITKILFVIYLFALCWILLFKLGVRFSYMAERRVNIIPFNGLLGENGEINLGEIIMNAVVFVPPGIYVGILYPHWTPVKKAFFFFLLSFLFEALQFIAKAGAFDITDVIANTFGGIIGLMIMWVIEKLVSSSAKAQQFVNILAVAGTLLMIAMLLLLKLNMLPVRYQ